MRRTMPQLGLAVLLLLGLVGVCAQNQTSPIGPSVPSASLPANLRQGLALYFNFDQPEPGGVVTDQSGNGNHGKVTGATWTPDGRKGGAYQFAAAGNFITVPNNPTLAVRHITLAAWIKTSYSDAVWRRIIDKQWDHGFAMSIGGAYTGKGKETSPRWKGRATSEMNGKFFASDEVVADGQWHHLVTTFDGRQQKLYVDGKLQHVGKPWNGAVESNAHDLTIGANHSNPDPRLDEVGTSFVGTIDEVMMYDHALTAEEVQQLFGLAGATGSTVAGGQPPSASNKGDQVERMKRVKQLYEQGLITKEQYDQKLKEILGAL